MKKIKENKSLGYNADVRTYRSWHFWYFFFPFLLGLKLK